MLEATTSTASSCSSPTSPSPSGGKKVNGDLKVPLTPTSERHKISRVIKVTKAKEDVDESKRTLDEVIRLSGYVTTNYSHH